MRENARLGRQYACARANAPSKSGNAPKSSTAAWPLAASISCRCPASPNPVTSVAACAPASRSAAPARSLSSIMDATAGRRASSSTSPQAWAETMIAVPRALCQVQRVARPCAGVAHDAVRVRHAEHGQAVLGFGVVDGVAAAHQGAGLAHGVGTALQDGGGHRSAQLLVECQQVECHQGLRSHRKHVGQGVGRSYASELVRVVHDGREEVDGEDCRRVVAQPVDRRVVARLEPEQQARPLAVLRGVRGDHEGVAQRPAAGGRRSLRVSAGGRPPPASPSAAGAVAPSLPPPAAGAAVPSRPRWSSTAEAARACRMLSRSPGPHLAAQPPFDVSFVSRMRSVSLISLPPFRRRTLRCSEVYRRFEDAARRASWCPRRILPPAMLHAALQKRLARCGMPASRRAGRVLCVRIQIP